MKCRICNDSLDYCILDLQNSPCSNDFLNEYQLNCEEITYPLKLFLCTNCFLVQVKEFKKANEIFSNEYIYHSSYSNTWLDHSKKFVNESVKRFNLNSSSAVMEIASNDGYLLQYIKNKNIPCVGIEPASNIANIAIKKNIPTINDFFSYDFASDYVKNNKKVDFLIANNVIAHVPTLKDFVKGIKHILNPDGVLSLEFPHLLNMINYNQFDTVYHEHFSYFSLFTLTNLLSDYELSVFDCEEIKTHGGSLRVYIKNKGDNKNNKTESVNGILNKELSAGINNVRYYDNFYKNTIKIKYKFLDYIVNKNLENKKIIAFGAAAKGNTFLNYCGIRKDFIDYVVDETPSKQGKYLPQSHIKVEKFDKIIQDRPDVIIIIPWNFKEEIIKKLEFTKTWNCELLTYIPTINIHK